MAHGRQAHADPKDLREFAGDLGALCAKITDHDRDLQRELGRLGETFRDQEYEKFRTHFQASRRKLIEFAEEMRQFAGQLEKDADHLAAAQRVKLDL